MKRVLPIVILLSLILSLFSSSGSPIFVNAEGAASDLIVKLFGITPPAYQM